MVPPAAGTGAAWTAPSPRSASDTLAGLKEGLAGGQLPEALRGFLDNIGQLGKTSNLPSGLDGLVGPMPTHAPAPLPEGARFETLTYRLTSRERQTFATGPAGGRHSSASRNTSSGVHRPGARAAIDDLASGE